MATFHQLAAPSLNVSMVASYFCGL